MAATDESAGVWDDKLAEALIEMAWNEGLIAENLHGTDGYFNRFKDRPAAPRWVRDQALEQLIITPRVLTLGYLPIEGIAGQLVEDGIIQPIARADRGHTGPRMSRRVPDPEPLRSGISNSVLAGMLRARGYKIRIDQFQSLLNQWNEGTQQQIEYWQEHGRPLPSAMDRFQAVFRLLLDPDDTPSSQGEDYELAERLERLKAPASPLVQCILHYESLISATASQGARLMSTPLISNGQKEAAVKLPAPSGASPELALLRVVAEDLGQRTHSSTLRETLKLARSPEARALREQLDHWTEAISTGELREVASLKADIANAKSRLGRARTVKKRASLITYLSIPVAMVEMVVGLVPVAGISLNVLDLGADLYERAVARRYRWAMFGTERS